MSGLPERQPLGSLSTSAARQAPRPLAPGPRPRPSSWVRHLEDNTDTDGERMQRLYPRIKPPREASRENDPYDHLETFPIHCGDSGHVATLHSPVVLHQSPWLSREVARRSGPDVPVQTPDHVRWWHVAWVLEYMYTGRVPGFFILANEEVRPRWHGTQPRSITWGLLELWDAADFFGLEGLKRRAEAALREYLSRGIRRSILIRRGALTPETAEGVNEPFAWPENRVAYEFCQAVWRTFGYQIWYSGLDYMDVLIAHDGYPYPGGIAQDENALLAWESSMFYKTGVPEREASVLEELAMLGRRPQSSFNFRPVMLDLCMHFAQSGLFELVWFTRFVTAHYGPEGLRLALAHRMRDPNARWPRDEYPRAPFSFRRVNPWRLIASNARAVPLRNAQQDGTDFFQ
ncbi:hypothetical protein INS49_014242 [Diaporthe citri]|uniref:uncharacterized protein n=1 Tax=Diaporthe citri TaxID=83186 RepID=UPI001C7F424D|nr:uncharacterized protein INS49_014242 [Diaporthe citri]KAG6358358.1 hypothetical protein INS49_014242 [Diaporthe citri]